MKTWLKLTLVALVLFLIGGISAGVYLSDKLVQEKAESQLKSCYNHRSFVPYELLSHFPGNDPENGFHIFQVLPYDENLPGYGVIAKYLNGYHWVEREDGIVERNGRMFREIRMGQNCHHGATGRFNGGWQGLNYPPETMKQLWAAHESICATTGRYRGLPYFWCGKPNNLSDVRAGGIVNREPGGGWGVDRDSVSPEDIEHLQRCLALIGEPPVEVDIPDKVDWEIYENDTTHKRVAYLDNHGIIQYRINP